MITEEEFLTPKSPEILLEGKTLQALIDLKKHPERVIYLDGAIAIERVFSPSVDVLKQYSLSNIGMLLKRNRRELSTTLYTDENKKKLLKKRDTSISNNHEVSSSMRDWEFSGKLPRCFESSEINISRF